MVMIVVKNTPHVYTNLKYRFVAMAVVIATAANSKEYTKWCESQRQKM